MLSANGMPMLMESMPDLMGPMPSLMAPMPSLMGATPRWPSMVISVSAGIAAIATAFTSVLAPRQFGKVATATTALGGITLGLALLELHHAKQELVVPTSQLNAATLEVVTGGVALASAAINAIVRS